MPPAAIRANLREPEGTRRLTMAAAAVIAARRASAE